MTPSPVPSEPGGHLDRVIDIIATETGLDRGSIRPEARLAEDVGLDSLQSVLVATGIEEQLGVVVSEDDIADLTTVESLAALVAARSRSDDSAGPR